MLVVLELLAALCVFAAVLLRSSQTSRAAPPAPAQVPASSAQAAPFSAQAPLACVQAPLPAMQGSPHSGPGATALRTGVGATRCPQHRQSRVAVGREQW